MKLALSSAAVLALAVVGACAQTPAQSAEAAPVKLWLSIEEPEICLGAASVPLRIEIENVSDRDVRIDPHRLAFQVSATRDNQVATATNDSVAVVPGDFRDLAPKTNYTTTVTYKLTDVIFAATGVMRLSVRYGQFRDAKPAYANLWKGTIESNGVLIRLRACAPVK
jgi:hypothetical protein